MVQIILREQLIFVFVIVIIHTDNLIIVKKESKIKENRKLDKTKYVNSSNVTSRRGTLIFFFCGNTSMLLLHFLAAYIR